MRFHAWISRTMGDEHSETFIMYWKFIVIMVLAMMMLKVQQMVKSTSRIKEDSWFKSSWETISGSQHSASVKPSKEQTTWHFLKMSISKSLNREFLDRLNGHVRFAENSSWKACTWPRLSSMTLPYSCWATLRQEPHPLHSRQHRHCLRHILLKWQAGRMVNWILG